MRVSNTRSKTTSGLTLVVSRASPASKSSRCAPCWDNGPSASRWVDRLGRNYEDVCDTIREFMRRGIVIRMVINNFTFDGAQIAKETGLTRQTVYRIKGDPAAAEAALMAWGYEHASMRAAGRET